MSSRDFEPVLMIWDYYDGVRSGLTECNGRPHYFNCLWDEPKGNYSEKFELSPIDASFLKAATTQWNIYREWELKFHTGLVQLETHPGNRGVNQEYDNLEDILHKKLKTLIKLKHEFSAKFRPLPNQDSLPTGVWRDLEVQWEELK